MSRPNEPTRPSGEPDGPAGLKILSAGSALYGMRPAAADFARGSGITVAVATDHGHNIEALAMAGSTDADIVAIPAAMMTRIVRAGCADAAMLVEIGADRRRGARGGAPR